CQPPRLGEVGEEICAIRGETRLRLKPRVALNERSEPFDITGLAQVKRKVLPAVPITELRQLAAALLLYVMHDPMMSVHRGVFEVLGKPILGGRRILEPQMASQIIPQRGVVRLEADGRRPKLLDECGPILPQQS